MNIHLAQYIIIQQTNFLTKNIMKRQQSSEKQKESQSKGLWECSTCTFKNHSKLKECQMCNTKRQGEQEQVQGKEKMESEKVSAFQCHACRHQLDSLVKKCPNCDQILIPEDSQQEQEQTKKQIKPQKKQQKMLKCRSCNQSNDPTNQTCVFCEQNLKQQSTSALIPIKKRACRKPRATAARARYTTNTCRYCKMNIYVASLQAHQQSCSHISKQQIQTRFLLVSRRYCTFCYKKFSPQQSDNHDKQCAQRKQFFLASSPTYKRCTKLQIQTMIYMHTKSEKLHWLAEQSLTKRIIALGYKASDLQNLHHYIVNYAPIIIHMHASRHMEFFVKDTHYRNQFETKKSSGSLSQTSRISWEDRMFDRMHHSATPFERVKYGTINFTNDPQGVKACVGYGISYFLLKPHVRNRCTVTDMDSSSPSATIATFQFCYHLLNKLPDAELKAAFEGSKANEVASNVIGSYKQIQIHGPVQFKQDIERVYINKAQMTDPANQKRIKQFCKRNDLQFEVFQNDKATTAPFGFGGLFPASPAIVAPSPSIFSFGSASSASVFSAPVASPSTVHLFGGGRAFGRRPASGLTVPPPKPEKQPEEGVDYI